MDDFTRFWAAYPRKVGKGAARKAFAKAIKLTSIEDMLGAIEDYKRHKPDWQPYCHPRTWLNQERWDDEWEPEQSGSILGAALDGMRNGRTEIDWN